MASQRRSHSVVLADSRAVSYGYLGQFSEYLAEYDKFSSYQYMPDRNPKELEKVFGAEALEPIQKLLTSADPQDKAMAREKLRQLNTLSHTLQDRFTFDGDVTIMGLDKDVIAAAQGIKDPKLLARLKTFHLAGHHKDAGMEDMWDATARDGIEPKGGDFRDKLVSRDVGRSTPQGIQLMQDGVTPVLAEHFADNFHTGLTSQMLGFKLEQQGIDYMDFDAAAVRKAFFADPNNHRVVLTGKVSPSQGWVDTATRLGAAPPSITADSEEDFYQSMAEESGSQSARLEKMRQEKAQARLEYVRANPPKRPAPPRPDAAPLSPPPDAPVKPPRRDKNKGLSDLSS